MSHRLLRRLLTVAGAALAGLIAVAGIALASGQAAVVITHGVSMNPVYYQGDLVIVARASSYSVGDIAAYNLPGKGEVALHRIIGGNPDGFIFKGDNNQSTDPARPRGDELVGRAVLHIAQGGLWLETLTSPPVLGFLAVALLAGGGAATTRHRRKQRRATVSRHINTRPGPHQFLGSLPSSLRISAALAAVFAATGMTLGVLAWSRPVEEPSISHVKTGTRMDFSYTADVGSSPAYDGTVAKSPDPVFRKLANTVEVQFTYHGEPGTMSVKADISAPGGWHTTIPLAGPATFTGPDHQGKVTLDLKALDAKAQAASAVTGLPAGQLTIVVTPEVKTTTGADFQPGLKLTLSPLQLALAGGTDTLTAADTTTTDQTAMTPRMIGFNGVGITAIAARFVSAILLLAALVIGAIIVVFARRTAPADEAAAIRRRYAAMLVRVHPMPVPQGRPVIDVTTFATLAKLAERYGLLVLHWARSGVETFIVQDENITYRYRPGAEPGQAHPQPEPVAPEPAHVAVHPEQ
ncbi:signal peptidase I [Arthrobacter bambusae]|uniref:signal peptidase I n=1 Tax=Arthrobacter bambusae TaxID=1338426 RepID=UPI002784A8B3|nr:signal peptidase I [Arthrobacter bambusae]MDQ0212639.1 signal peptidase I [Arthrobacter bambusae]MDQ0237084.1 signal peptidase I [Arthrobacter bambusae]